MSDDGGSGAARVSVLIPTYDRPGFLAQAIDAALGSTTTDIEVIVGDNGNQGGEICSARPDRRLHYVRHPAQLGMAGNWNALLDLARSEFVALCSDDDRIAPTFVERCLACFEEDPGLDVVFTNHDLVSGAHRRTRDCALPPGRHDDFAATFLEYLPVAASAAMFRHEAWQAVRPMPDTAAADMVLFGRLAGAGYAFYYLAESLMDYRTHDAMLSSTDAFKDDAVLAWNDLRFTDERAELRRRELLGEALCSRAALKVRVGDAVGARQDAREASSLLRGTARRRARALGALANAPRLVPLAVGLAHARRRVSAAFGEPADPRRDTAP